MSKVNEDTSWRDMITALRTLPKPVITTPKDGTSDKLRKSSSLHDVRPSFRDNKYIVASLKQSKGSPSGATGASDLTPNSRMPSGMFTDLFNQNLSVNQKYERYLAHIDADDLKEPGPQPDSAASKEDGAQSKKDRVDNRARIKQNSDTSSGVRSGRPLSGCKSHRDLMSNERPRESLIGDESYENLQNARLEFRHRVSPRSRSTQPKVTFKDELQYKFLNEEGSVRNKPRHLMSPDRVPSSSSEKLSERNEHFRKDKIYEVGKIPASR